MAVPAGRRRIRYDPRRPTRAIPTPIGSSRRSVEVSWPIARDPGPPGSGSPFTGGLDGAAGRAHDIIAAVDVEDLAGDPAGEVREQEHAGRADFLAGDIPPQR